MADVTLEMNQHIFIQVTPKDEQGNPILSDYKPGSLEVTVDEPTLILIDDIPGNELMKKVTPLLDGVVTINHTIRGKKNDNLIVGNDVSIQVNGFTAVASEMTFSPVQTNS